MLVNLLSWLKFLSEFLTIECSTTPCFSIVLIVYQLHNNGWAQNMTTFNETSCSQKWGNSLQQSPILKYLWKLEVIYVRSHKEEKWKVEINKLNIKTTQNNLHIWTGERGGVVSSSDGLRVPENKIKVHYKVKVLHHVWGIPIKGYPWRVCTSMLAPWTLYFIHQPSWIFALTSTKSNRTLQVDDEQRYFAGSQIPQPLGLG